MAFLFFFTYYYCRNCSVFIYNIAYDKMKTSDDFGNQLMQLLPMKSTKPNENKPKNNRNQTNDTTVANATTQRKTKKGAVLKCMACGGNHYLCQCEDSKAKEKLKTENPDLYNRHINSKPKTPSTNNTETNNDKTATNEGHTICTFTHSRVTATTEQYMEWTNTQNYKGQRIV